MRAFYAEEPPRNTATNLKVAGLISLIIVLPFAILESLNNAITRENALGVLLLFGLLWLLPTIFIILVVPTARAVRARNWSAGNAIRLLAGAACLVLIATVWGSLVIDQLPCFVGVPNCD